MNNLKLRRVALIVGFPYFGKKISDQLEKHFPTRKFPFIDNRTKLDKARFLFQLPLASTIYSIGGHAAPRKWGILSLLLGKRMVFHWVGSDVMWAQDDAKKGIFSKKYVSRIHHLCECDWIKKELSDIGISALIVPLATLEGKVFSSSVFPDNFSILTYIPNGREDLYQFPWIIELAKAFPDVEINVLAKDRDNKLIPTNIKLLGWEKDMAYRYSNSVLYLRLPKHDGLAFSVLEALANQRYVAYSFPYPSTFHVTRIEELIKVVTQLKARFESGDLPLNSEGGNLIRRMFNERRVVQGIYDQLFPTQIFGDSGGP